jgi:hypothetical protein
LTAAFSNSGDSLLTSDANVSHLNSVQLLVHAWKIKKMFKLGLNILSKYMKMLVTKLAMGIPLTIYLYIDN